MSEKRPNTLFFITSPNYKLTTVETFLKKRNYEVHIATDVKAALLKLIEVQPDMVFIALDHGSPKIEVLPQIIQQCIDTHIVPFTNSNSRDSIKKLDENASANKIFPPLSGPAVERMSIKLTAKTGVEKALQQKNSDLIVSKFLEELNEKQKPKLGEGLPDKAKTKRLKNNNFFYAKAQKTKITEQQKENLRKEFEATIKSDLIDILETCQNGDSSNVIALNQEKKTIYCLLVQSQNWSGHLMAYSNQTLDSNLLEPVFKNWISKEFKYFNEEENHIFFEIQINLKDFQVWVENKSEYSENLKVNNSELSLSFVGIEPKHLLMEFDEENDLIDVRLEWVPLKTELNLSLYLHLPENKKFLLYTPKGQQMSAMQMQRLVENRVERLYSPIEFEEEVKKLKMAQYFELLFSGLGTESAE